MSDDNNKYYSKQNPNGPYQNRSRPDSKPRASDYIEGKPTQKNLNEWADYSKRHSDDPSITNKKMR
jgi:hypothetical protein